MKKWMGSKPVACDLCKNPFDRIFIDGRIRNGMWGLLCEDCHDVHGCGLGTGKGQMYDLRTLVKLEG